MAIETLSTSDSASEFFRKLNANFGECKNDNLYNGMKMVSLGDSITYGYVPRNHPDYVPNQNTQLPSYAALTAQLLGMSFVNYGITGSSVSVIAGQNRNPMCNRISDMDSDADVITFMGGTNDVTNGVELGTFSDRVNTTFYGALHAVMQGLYTRYIAGQSVDMADGKKRKIVVCTPIKLLNPTDGGSLYNWRGFIEAIKEVAAYYSFPVCDMYNMSLINPHLDRTLQGYTTGYTGLYNKYVPDGTHPTEEGHEMMADLLVGFLKSLK